MDSTLIQAWAGRKSFVPKNSGEHEQGGDGDHDDHNGHGSDHVTDAPDPGDFKGTQRSNTTHESRTDPDARLICKGDNASRLRFMGHDLTENRHGLMVNACIAIADGHAEREAAKPTTTRKLTSPLETTKATMQRNSSKPSRA